VRNELGQRNKHQACHTPKHEFTDVEFGVGELDQSYEHPLEEPTHLLKFEGVINASVGGDEVRAIGNAVLVSYLRQTC